MPRVASRRVAAAVAAAPACTLLNSLDGYAGSNPAAAPAQAQGAMQIMSIFLKSSI